MAAVSSRSERAARLAFVTGAPSLRPAFSAPASRTFTNSSRSLYSVCGSVPRKARIASCCARPSACSFAPAAPFFLDCASARNARLLKKIEADPRYDKRKAEYLLKSFVELHPHAIGEKVRICVEHFAAQVQGEIGSKAKAMIVP